MGPPEMISVTLSLIPPQNARMSRILVPTGTMRFPGLFTPGPVTVTTRSMRGSPVSKISAMQAMVPTF